MLLPPPVPEEGRCPTVPKKSPQKRGMQRVLARPMYTATVYDMRLRTGTAHLLPRPNEVINPAAPPCMPGRREGREAHGDGSDGWPSSPSCPITSAYLCMYIQGNPHIPTQSWSPILSYHLCILVYLCVYWPVLSHGLGGVGGDVWCDLSCHSIHHIGRKAVVCICVLYCFHIAHTAPPTLA